MRFIPPVNSRVYVVVPACIDIPSTKQIVGMSCGRLIAQACHVVSRLKLRLKLDPDTAQTTIVLKVANSKELAAVREKLIQAKKTRDIHWEEFRDDNEPVYGTNECMMTALACYCSKKQGKSLFHGLESWTCENEP